MTEKGVATTEVAPIKDGIAPALRGVTILENEGHQSPLDTLKIIFTEPVVLPYTSQWPLRVTDGTSEVSQSAIKVISATTADNGRSWLYVISGNDGGLTVKQGQKAEILSNFSISDKFMNGLTKAGIISKTGEGLNRKMLSELAISDPKAFGDLVKTAKKALEK